jgi:hypothetical protein
MNTCANCKCWSYEGKMANYNGQSRYRFGICHKISYANNVIEAEIVSYEDFESKPFLETGESFGCTLHED